MAPALPTRPSRRQLLRTGAALGALSALPIPSARALTVGDPDVLRVGLVGCGGRGTGAAANALRAENGSIVLTAMGDLFPERLAGSLQHLTNAMGEAADRIQVDPERRFTGFDAYQHVLASDIDVVLLCTPPHFRPVQLAAAVAAGKHIFTEKPMAVDGPGIRSVMQTAAAAKAAGLGLMSGFCWRRNVRHKAFFEQLHAGRIGEIRGFHSTYLASPIGTHKRQPEWSDMEFQLKNWHHFPWLSGDHVVEQAVHSLDKQGWCFEDRPPLSVTAMGGRQNHRGDERGVVFDHFSASYDYGDGVLAFHQSRQMDGCDFENNDYIMGEKGSGIINGWAPLHALQGPDPWIYEGPGNDMYQAEHDELFASIRAGAPVNDGEWMTRSSMLAIMLRMSAYTGHTVTWEQAMASNERLGPERYAFGEVAVGEVAVPGKTQLI
ncbi:MAG: gfo/Idh/MocA family oxidoreductase [Planctomycetota bacterium]|nr:MAG: gfo/Idh/MocA family oxidoreductase [Planctomycetota bacterium]